MSSVTFVAEWMNTVNTVNTVLNQDPIVDWIHVAGNWRGFYNETSVKMKPVVNQKRPAI